MSHEILDFVKDFIWAPLLAMVGYFWARNQKEHDMLWKAHKERIGEIQTVRKDAGDSHSALMNRIVDHVDSSVNRAMSTMRDEDARLHEEVKVMRGHIEKLFENAEGDRALFRDMLLSHVQRSEDRHVELLKGQHDIIQLVHTGLANKVDRT